MDRFEKARRYARQAVDAMILFSAREAGHARLCDISEGGLGIRAPHPAVEPGSRIPITVSVGLNRLGPFVARVVWSHDDRAGLEVDATDPKVRRQLAQALRDLTSQSA